MAIGIAIIGSGIFVKEEHLPAVQATSILSLKAVYSRSSKTVQSLAENLSGVDLYSDDSDGKTLDDLLKRDDIKAVIIALPITVQHTYIQRALSFNKHVLAEKPIAKDISTATTLLSWTRSPSNTSALLSIAENFRFLDSFVYASQQIAKLGRILTFRVRVAANVKPGSKYYETEWRKSPSHQGGFLLDGGVHFVAGTRLLLSGAGERIVRVSAFTGQLQEHLEPLDTLNATMQLSNGASGTLGISFGTTDTGSEYVVACEKGSVRVASGKVTVTMLDGKEEVKEFPDEGAGVGQEVRAWAQSLEEGRRNEMQSPEEALRDLEVIEAALTSGEGGGRAVELKC